MEGVLWNDKVAREILTVLYSITPCNIVFYTHICDTFHKYACLALGLC